MIIPRFEKLRQHVIPFLLIVVSVSAVYGRLLGHGFQNLDDSWYVTNNDAITGFTWLHMKEVFSTFYVGNYAPVQMLSYMLDYTLWGMQPGGFYFTNIVIHAANGMLVYLLLVRFHGDRLLASVAAGIFLLHPVQVESVAWISQRKNLLAMLFFLIAWECYCRYRESSSIEKKVTYILSLLFFVLSLLSKSIAIIFPIVLLTFDFCFPVARRRIFLIDKIPFICAAVAIAVVAMYSQLPEVGEGGRVAELHGGSVLGTVFTMLPVFCRYLGMIVWPSSLSAEYHPPVHSSLDGAVLGACLILLTIAGGGWLLYRSDRRLGFWVCFFFVALLPVSQIVPLLTLMNDRYLYFPILSVAALGGSAATVLLRTVDRHPKLVCLFITLPLITLSIVTYKRVGVWRGPVELWSDAATKTPDSSRVWGNLGNAYDASGNRGLAGYAYKRGLEIDPNNEQILFDSGSMYMRLGDNYQAYILLKRLLYLLPNHIMGLVFYGDICLQRGDYAEAEKSYLRAHSLQPDAVDPLVALGNSAVITKRFDDAREYYFKAEKIYEENPDIAYNIACVDSMSGRIDSALLWLDKALHRGFHDETTLRTSQELLLVRGDSRFERLMAHYFTKGLK